MIKTIGNVLKAFIWLILLMGSILPFFIIAVIGSALLFIGKILVWPYNWLMLYVVIVNQKLGANKNVNKHELNPSTIEEDGYGAI